MAPQNATCRPEARRGLTELNLDTGAGQQTPIRLDKGATGGQVDDQGGAARAQARALQSTAASRGYPGCCTPFVG
jgi:hypothetical protein